MPEQKFSESDILKAAQKFGIDEQTAKKVSDEKGRQELLNSLSEKDRQKVTEVLKNPELTKQLLSSPKAKDLLKNLFGDKQNGN